MEDSKWKRGAIYLSLIIALILIAPGHGESQGPKPTVQLRVGALVPGTTGYLYPVAMAPVIEKYSSGRIKMTISPTRGAPESLGYMRDKKMDMGFVGPEVMYQSWYGKGAWEGKPDRSHRALWVYVLGVGHAIVLGDSPVKTLNDLKGKKIGCLEVGSAGAMMVEQIVEVLGWNPRKDVTLRPNKASAGFDALKDRVVDAFSFMAGPPSSLIVSLATTHDYRLIEIPAEIADRINRKYYVPGVWVPYAIPKGTYPKQTSDYQTITPAYCLVAREDVPEEVIYELTKIFWEHQGEVAANYAQAGKYTAEHLKLIQGEFVPFHPGALKYYRQKGWMK
jgi:TRAP transporter TAXI family solute receptor